MKGTMLISAAAVGVVIGSAATVAVIPHLCTNPRTRKKYMKYKDHMFKTVGTVLDAMGEFRR